MLTLYVLIVYTIYMHYCRFLLTTAIHITLLLRTFSVGTIPYENFRLHYHNWKTFYELIKFRTIHCTMSIYIFNMHHSKWQPKYKVFWLTTFVCTIEIYKPLKQYCNAQHFYALLILIIAKLSPSPSSSWAELVLLSSRPRPVRPSGLVLSSNITSLRPKAKLFVSMVRPWKHI